jgi:hypothetical protein
LVKIQARIKLTQLGHRERTDIRAVREAKENKIPAPLKVGFGEEFTLLVDQAKFTQGSSFWVDGDAYFTQRCFTRSFTAQLKEGNQSYNDKNIED